VCAGYFCDVPRVQVPLHTLVRYCFGCVHLNLLARLCDGQLWWGTGYPFLGGLLQAASAFKTLGQLFSCPVLLVAYSTVCKGSPPGLTSDQGSVLVPNPCSEMFVVSLIRS